MDMTITVTITRSDLFWVHVQALPRVKSTYIVLSIIWGSLFFSRYLDDEKTYPILALLFATFIVASLILLSMYVISFLFYFLLGSKTNGVLGNHQYQITHEGLLEETDVNRTLTKWSGITKILKTKRYLFVQISWYLFHIIPRRAFKNNEEFERFCCEVHNGKYAI